MIDQWSHDRTGWARFSDDMTMRYRLARNLNGLPIEVRDGHIADADRVTFLMLNPSTADAFKHDPTVGECIKRARQLGADVLEVVNLFAFRSPYPTDLRARAHGQRGDDHLNDGELLAACTDAYVIAAWGTGGRLDWRDEVVRKQIARVGIKLHHLGTTQDGFPKHPLARGRHRIPADQQPIAWSAP